MFAGQPTKSPEEPMPVTESLCAVMQTPFASIGNAQLAVALLT